MEPNTQPAMDPQNTPPAVPTEKKVGPIIASLLIILALIFVALYLFASHITTPVIPDDSMTEIDTEEMRGANDEVQPVTSTSTDVDSMQADLDASTNGLDNQNF